MLANQGRASSTRIITSQQDRVRDYANPVTMARNLWQQRQLINQFTRRQISQRYKGSFLGIVWSFITPLALLVVYTFAFSIVLRVTWPLLMTDSHAEVALILFTGMVAFSVFSEAVVNAPHQIVGNSNYVKRVVFPLEILSVSDLGSILVHSSFSLIILLLGVFFVVDGIPWTVIFLPLMYIPLIFLSLGLSWFFASLGVFIRDLTHFLGVAVTMLFFTTPIFYPIEIIPEEMRFVVYINPLAFIVNHFRRVILWGQVPDWGEYLVLTLMTFIICMLGYIWFMKSKKTFADVV